MAIRVVLQSRLSSSRLPAKALLTLAGRPVVVLAAQRAGNTGADVVVATSSEPEDDAIADALADVGIRCFRGSLHDPLQRFVRATADLQPQDLVVRLTGDNVVPDGAFVNDLVAHMHEHGESYVRVTTDGLHGLGAEVFTVDLLRRAEADSDDAYDHEHVTPWIRRHTGDLTYVPALTGPAARVRCTIDALHDYRVAVAALRGLPDPVAVPWRELADRWAAVGGARRSPLPTTTEGPLDVGPWVLQVNRLGTPDAPTAPVDLAVVARLLDRAWDLGVTHVATDGADPDAELRVGRSLAHGLAERVGVLATAAPLHDVPDEAPAAWARAAVDARVEAALHRLRSSRVDALIAGSWRDWNLAEGAVADHLTSLAQGGAARVVGVTVNRAEQLLAAQADPRIGLIVAADRPGRSIVAEQRVREALATRPDVILAAAPNSSWSPRGPMEMWSTYLRSQPGVDTVVLGARTADDLDVTAELVRRPLLDADEVGRAERLLGELDA